MGLTRFAINIAAKNPPIDSFTNYLFIGPHPDDIEIGAGATISKLAKLGKHIVFLICTDGRYGKENIEGEISCEELAQMRKEECIQSAKYLGVEDVRFLNLCDGGKYTYDELLKGIADTINEVKPDIVFAPDPDIPSECHKDHLWVGKATKELANFANYKEIFESYLSEGKVVNEGINVEAIALYMTNKPNKYFKTKGHLKRQFEALYMHKSQYPKGIPATNTVTLYLKLRAIEFGFKKFCIHAEGFRMMNRTRMHCLPEASK